MAKIVCNICDASFDDEGLDKCPVCGSELSKNDEPILKEESALIGDNAPEANEIFAEEVVAEAPVTKEEIVDEDVNTETDEELKPTGEFEYSAPFGEAPAYDEDVATEIYAEAIRMMESVTQDTPYIVFKKIADKLETIKGYKNADDLRKVCLDKAEMLCKESFYKEALSLESSSSRDDVERAILVFSRVLDYKDAREHIALCNEKLELLGDRNGGNAFDGSFAVKEKKVKEKKAKEKKPILDLKLKFDNKAILAAIISGAVALVVAIALLTVFLIVPSIKYGNATNLLERGKYSEAYSAYGELNEFRDSKERMEVIVILYAMELGAYDDAGEEMINTAIEELLATDHDVVVVYDHGYGDKKESVELSHDEKFTGIAAVTREGYKFVDYKLGDFGFEDGKANITVKAVWDGDYTVTVDLDGGEKKDANGDKINYPSEYSVDDEADIVFVNPTKVGYTFVGWSGSDITGTTMELKLPKGSYGDKEYKANWTANEYKLTYDANEGNVSVKNATVVFGSDYVMPIPTRTGYTFLGWADESGNIVEQEEAWSVASDLNLKALWEYQVYTITYSGAEKGVENPNSSTFIIGSPTIKLKTPKRDGYTFKGWYSDSKYSNKITQIDTSVLDDVTVYAKWEIIKYTVVYESEGTIAKKYLTFTVEDLPFKLPVDDGDNDFKAWVDEDYNEIAKIDRVGDVVIRAKYYDSSSKTYYVKDTDGYVVYEYNGSDATVDLSKKYNGKYIVGICDDAFTNSNKLTKVILGSHITFIGDSAFEGCSKLDTVTIPLSVTVIGKNAFYDCDSDLVIKCDATEKPSGWDKKWYGDSEYEFAD